MGVLTFASLVALAVPTPSRVASPSPVASPSAAAATAGSAVNSQPLLLLLAGLVVLVAVLIVVGRVARRRKGNDAEAHASTGPAPAVDDEVPPATREIYSPQPSGAFAVPPPAPPLPAPPPAAQTQEPGVDLATPAPAAYPPPNRFEPPGTEPARQSQAAYPAAPLAPWVGPPPADSAPPFTPVPPAIPPTPVQETPPPFLPSPGPALTPDPPVAPAPPSLPPIAPPAPAPPAPEPPAPAPGATGRRAAPTSAVRRGSPGAGAVGPTARPRARARPPEPVVAEAAPVVAPAAPPAETPPAPVAEAAGGAVAVPDEAAGEAKPQLILLIEDDERIAKFYTILFQAKGFAVENARDGVEGVDMANALKPALILLDVMMPKMNGLMVLQTLRANPETETTPVVVLSNYMEPPLIQRALQLGAIEYVVKSQARPEQLVNALPYWLRGEPALH